MKTTLVALLAALSLAAACAAPVSSPSPSSSGGSTTPTASAPRSTARIDPAHAERLKPVPGTLISRAYGRHEEYQADAHGAEILKRAGYSPKVMEQTLTWLLNTEGGSEGGFFSTHPATDDRIAALRRTGGE